MSYTINLSKAGAPGAASAPLGSPSKDHRHKGKQPRVALLLLLAGGVYAMAVVSRMYSNPGPRPHGCARWMIPGHHAAAAAMPQALAKAIVPRPKGAAYELRVHGFVAEKGCDHNFFLLAWTTAAESAKEGARGRRSGAWYMQPAELPERGAPSGEARMLGEVVLIDRVKTPADLRTEKRHKGHKSKDKGHKSKDRRKDKGRRRDKGPGGESGGRRGGVAKKSIAELRAERAAREATEKLRAQRAMLGQGSH
eukprot:jgi/Tetstr1/424720/TSEL_015238.t1